MEPGGTGSSGKARLEHHILIVSDEVHADLLFEGSKHTCFPTLSPEVEQNTILCTGASKTFNLAGLKTSSIIIPDPELREKFKTVLNRYNVGSGNTLDLWPRRRHIAMGKSGWKS